jgi:hypothetical protein
MIHVPSLSLGVTINIFNLKTSRREAPSVNPVPVRQPRYTSATTESAV